MKKFFKWIGIIIGAIVVIGIVASLGSSNDDGKVVKTSGDGEKIQHQKEKESDLSAKIGDSLKVDDVVFRVTHKEVTDSVGGEYGAKSQGKYLVLDVQVKNEKDKAITIDSSFFKILADGKEYDPDTEGTTLANETSSGFFLQEINPDINQKGKIVFDLPDDLIDKDLILQVSTGFLGTHKGKISLN